MDRRLSMTLDYVRTYDDADLTNEYADELLAEFFDIRNDQLRIEKKYIRRFKRVLPSLKVAQFYQLENKMNTEIDAELALIIPLVDPS